MNWKRIERTVGRSPAQTVNIQGGYTSCMFATEGKDAFVVVTWLHAKYNRGEKCGIAVSATIIVFTVPQKHGRVW